MRRIIPLALMGILTVGAVAGAAVAVASVPKQNYTPSGALAAPSSPPAPGIGPGAPTPAPTPKLPLASRSVLQTFRVAVQNTVAARSFVVEQGTVVAYYNEPDRVRQGTVGITPPSVEVVIGNATYQEPRVGSTTSGPPSWTEVSGPVGRATTVVGQDLALLRRLLTATHLTEDGATFTVDAPGVAAPFTVQTKSGFVRQISGPVGVGPFRIGGLAPQRVFSRLCRALARRLHGIMPEPALGNGKNSQICSLGLPNLPSPRTPSPANTSITFSFLNSAPTVTPPPASQITKTHCTSNGPGSITCVGVPFIPSPGTLQPPPSPTQLPTPNPNPPVAPTS